MLCYEMILSYEKTAMAKKEEPFEERDDREEITRLNNKLFRLDTEDICHAFVAEHDDTLQMVCVMDFKALPCAKEYIGRICHIVEKEMKIEKVSVKEKNEITLETFGSLIETAEENSYINRRLYRIYQKINSDSFGNRSYRASEEVLECGNFSKAAALSEARTIMADESLIEEITRIYDKKNQKKFYGFPVHYCITSDGTEAAMPMVKLLVRALHARNRLPGSRITYVTGITSNCYDEDDFVKLCRRAAGSSVLIELKGEEGNRGIYAASFDRVINFIMNVVSECKQKTQFFFVQNVSYEGFSKNLLSRIREEVQVVHIHEGAGDAKAAKKYFMRLVNESRMSELAGRDALSFLPGKMSYRPHDVHDAYERWNSECLSEKAYPAYSNVMTVSVAVKKEKKAGYYQELQAMVGLARVKELCDEIISSFKMQKIRERYGLDEQDICRHMIFTGNPGSAKTTVARLLCEILNEEGVLETGKLVECGRADLVGKYVGWTAQQVKRKFRDAVGGMLFIDEAYSLVDNSHSFGEEAINTIVQEMENHRDNVIVVFAGYPDRMEKFLESNEGLRSRIAFHLDFPDYNEDELLEILKNMMDKRQLVMDEDAMPVCHELFRKACGVADFGNGRYVRNVLEQAILRQGKRLLGNGGIREMRKITKDQTQRLTADDFMVDTGAFLRSGRKNEIKMGFSA
ncbi:MAG: AAA family ATPase [Lachnospiraceae bacterium]|nr:AAA family ATPase [Lachnospiraceae bacterium]